MRRVVRNVGFLAKSKRCFGDAELTKERSELAEKILCSDCFEVMGVDRTYLVDDYKKRFRQLQSLFHPDVAVKETSVPEALSERVSAKCNDCHSALSDPYRRGCLLLKLETGRDVDDEERAAELADSLDDEFLERIMDIKLEVFEATSDDDVEEMKRLSSLAQEEFDGLLRTLAEALSRKEFIEAENTLLKMNYFRKIILDLQEALPPE